VNSGSSLDWPAIRLRAAVFPDEAFEFVRDGVKHTVQILHGASKRVQRQPLEQVVAAVAGEVDESRHISGQQLCMGLRDFAIQRYGLLAGIVLERWGVKRTDDFGTIVYALIDRKELRASSRDSFEDFKGVYEFGETFGALTLA
jgi:uncharacterized repeat protein (TIGR04138 family)